MKILNIAFLFILSLFTMVACIEHNTGPFPKIDEPGGSAHYYINNQSETNLDIIYTTLGSPTDSLITALIDSSIRIFEDGGVGINPTPATSFSKISFYLHTDSKPALTINPIENDTWNIIGRKGFEDSNYGFTEYELVITDDDLK